MRNSHSGIFIFLLGLLCPCISKAQFVWQLNHSFSLNTSTSGPGMQLDATQPDLFFFPLEPEYSILKNKSSPAFAYLCFVYFTPTPPNNTKLYTLSICLDTSETNHYGQPYQVATVVWTANRGAPVTGEVLSLMLQNNGDLVLGVGNDHTPAWSSGTANVSLGVARMELTLSKREGANLILFDSLNKSVWQSTDNPSDTLTELQWLVRNSSRQKLTSRSSRTNTADGIYNLEVEPGGIVLYASFPSRVPYWMWIIHDMTCSAIQVSLMNASCRNGASLQGINLDSLGVNCWVKSSVGGGFGFVPYTCLRFASTGSEDLVNRTFLKIYWDGNLRAHTLQYSATQDTHRVTLMDVFSLKQCDLPLRCGPYGVCRGTSSPQCECPADSTLFHPVDMSDSTQGCAHAQPLLSTCSNNNMSAVSNKSTLTSQVMHRTEGLDYFSNAFVSPLPIATEEGCSDGCLQNCSCLAAFWYAHEQGCYHVEQMGSLRVAQNQSFIAFLKVNPSPVSPPEQNRDGSSTGSKKRKSNVSAGSMAGIVVSGLAALLALTCSVVCFIVRRGRHHDHGNGTDNSEDSILDHIPGLPTRFSYAELHDITKGFSSKLGKGGFGAVYLGILPDGTKVAVKQLESVKQGDKEFRSEVAIMAGIHHYNLLHLWGFCAQKACRLLVYEYMVIGSLDQWLFKRSNICSEGDGGEQIVEKYSPLPWEVRCKIVLGAARGLAYLHEECRERILHLDIKPQNILLDDEFVAKVADFGLSRLMERDKSVVVTTMRGTPGYLAPEWLKEAGSIDVKCDVFSFGMLLLEVVSGRKNTDHSVQLTEQIYYPEWAYQQIAYSAQHKGLTIADELTDSKLESNRERAQLINMITVAFLCVADNPEWRPSMAQVVKMLESGEHEDHLKASQALRQRRPQLVFVLMSQPQGSFSVDYAATVQSYTTSSSSNYSGVAPSSTRFSQVSGR